MPKTSTVQSMTGFAAVQREFPSATLSLELRSVNGRFLDLALKIPEELRWAEPVLRERLNGAVQRGKLECRIAFGRRVDAARQPALDRGLLASLARVAAEVRAVVPEAAPLSTAELMRWPGVMQDDRFDAAELVAAIGEMLDAALIEFIASRQREGARLTQGIVDRVQAIEAIVTRVAEQSPQLLRSYEDRLTERLRTVLAEAGAATGVPTDEIFNRVRQEVTLYGLRIDVAEELSRLASHAAEVRQVLVRGGPVGKRLDFLMQELNREANTLGSKAAAVELSAAAMELKLLIEQIREQVQNIE